MIPAGTSNELDVQNEWEENTHTHTHTHTHFTKMVFDEFAGVVAVPARMPARFVGGKVSPP